MIKRTIQEIADFFGMYAVKDQSEGHLWLLEHKPFLHKRGEYKGFWDESAELDKTMLINGEYTVDFETHDYKVLVVPKELK